MIFGKIKRIFISFFSTFSINFYVHLHTYVIEDEQLMLGKGEILDFMVVLGFASLSLLLAYQAPIVNESL